MKDVSTRKFNVMQKFEDHNTCEKARVQNGAMDQ